MSFYSNEKLVGVKDSYGTFKHFGALLQVMQGVFKNVQK